MHVLYILLVALLLVGCDPEKRDWARAVKAGTIEAYQQYVEAHPDGANAQEAHTQVMELSWQQAVATDSVAAIKRFMAEFPGSPYEEEGRTHIERLQTVSQIQELLYRPSANAEGTIEINTPTTDGCRTVRFAGRLTIGKDNPVITGQARVLMLEKLDADAPAGPVSPFSLVFIPGLHHRYMGEVCLPGPTVRYRETSDHRGQGSTIRIDGRWLDGALRGTHRVTGTLRLPDDLEGTFRIYGDPGDPLILRVSEDGYKYSAGRGRIITPDGVEFVFEP